MLISYADSIGNNLDDLSFVLENYLEDVIGSLHLLPFFPSTGDRGFAPSDYTKVDAAFGNWDNIEALSQKYALMFDFMINHISKESVFLRIL